jgi:hypothetical protein
MDIPVLQNLFDKKTYPAISMIRYSLNVVKKTSGMEKNKINKNP